MTTTTTTMMMFFTISKVSRHLTSVFYTSWCQTLLRVSGRISLNQSARGDMLILWTPASIHGPRSATVSGSVSWNYLPPSLHDLSLLPGQFRRRLKTFLFRRARQSLGREIWALLIPELMLMMSMMMIHTYRLFQLGSHRLDSHNIHTIKSENID